MLPEHVGVPFFGEGNFNSINIQIHYDNPLEIENQYDSSGMRFYYVLEPREQEATYLQVGDPLIRLRDVEIGDGLSEWSFDCASTCSSFALGGQPVTVISEGLHMHKSGVRMIHSQIRNGQVVRSAKIDVYDFEHQGNFEPRNVPYEVQPGDSFQTTCYYRDGNTFGLSSQEEMCVAFLLYYPAKRFAFGGSQLPWLCGYGLDFFPPCDARLTNQSVATDDGLGRVFGSSAESCDAESDAPGENETESGGNNVSTVSVLAMAFALAFVATIP